MSDMKIFIAARGERCMSFMEIAGLRAECLICGKIIEIKRNGESALLEAGDQADMEPSEIRWLREGLADPEDYRISAICRPCVKPLLISREASLYKEVEELCRTLHELNKSHQLAFEEALLTLCWDSKDDGGEFRHRLDILGRYFPSLYDEFLKDPRCGKHPDFFAKRKRRFFHEARRKLEKDGLFIEGKAAEAKHRQEIFEQSCQPAITRLLELHKESKHLPGSTNGQIFCAREVNYWDVNTAIAYKSGYAKIFTADSDSGDPTYLLVYADGLREHIESKLLTPRLKGTRGNELTPRVEEFLIEKLRGVVEGLVWPVS